MIRSLTLMLAMAVAPALAFAQSAPESGGKPAEIAPGRALVSELFLTTDLDRDGRVTIVELLQFGEMAQTRLDADESGDLSFAEFMDGGVWIEDLTAYRDRGEAVQTAFRIVFDFWDRGNDGALSSAEHQAGLVSGFAYADLDGDMALSEQEYLGGFVIAIALRNALVI